jgi:hypothetical protein
MHGVRWSGNPKSKTPNPKRGDPLPSPSGGRQGGTTWDSGVGIWDFPLERLLFINKAG